MGAGITGRWNIAMGVFSMCSAKRRLRDGICHCAIFRPVAQYDSEDGRCLRTATFSVRADIADLFALADPKYAVLCVHHDYIPPTRPKMDGQVNAAYPRKNLSSVCLWNCDHPAHRTLTLERLNTLPGRDLHAFCWLWHSQIGVLPPDWNYLVGVSPRIADPSIAHMTLGTPDMAGYEHCEFADEWLDFLREAVAL